MAQIVFYLLLLSFAEHLGFDLSFLIAGSCTVALLSANTEWVFGTRQHAIQAGGVFAMLYTFIYVLLRVEAYALLVGAVAAFVAVAAAMYFTRQVDWFGGGEARAARRVPTPPLRESFLE